MTSQQFKYNGPAGIVSMNTRKVGNEEIGKELEIDIKFNAFTGYGVIDYFDPWLRHALFTEDGMVRNGLLAPIDFLHEMRDYLVIVMGREFYGVSLKKFTIEPADGGRAYIKFTATFKPMGDDVARLAEYLQDELNILVCPVNRELLL